MPPARRLLGLLLLPLLLAGCAALLERPRVSIANVTLKEVKLFEQLYTLELRIQNPNDTALTITGLTFNLEVNDKAFATGLTSAGVTIERLGTGLLAVEAVSPLTSLLRQIQAAQQGGLSRLRYRLRGALYVTELGVKLPFDEQGEIELPTVKTP